MVHSDLALQQNSLIAKVWAKDRERVPLTHKVRCLFFWVIFAICPHGNLSIRSPVLPFVIMHSESFASNVHLHRWPNVLAEGALSQPQEKTGLAHEAVTEQDSFVADWRLCVFRLSPNWFGAEISCDDRRFLDDAHSRVLVLNLLPGTAGEEALASFVRLLARNRPYTLRVD